MQQCHFQNAEQPFKAKTSHTSLTNSMRLTHRNTRRSPWSQQLQSTTNHLTILVGLLWAVGQKRLPKMPAGWSSLQKRRPPNLSNTLRLGCKLPFDPYYIMYYTRQTPTIPASLPSLPSAPASQRGRPRRASVHPRRRPSASRPGPRRSAGCEMSGGLRCQKGLHSRVLQGLV